MGTATHEVFNQPEPLVDVDLFEANRPLQDALRVLAPELDWTDLRAAGARWGTREMQQHARLANVHGPQLRTHDRRGHRIDEVEFHPSYHALMAEATAAGLHGTPFAPAQATSGHAHVRRAAGFLLFTELEPSVLCPISMTYAVTPALRANAAVARDWLPKLTARAYDPRLVPWHEKAGATMGMGMTEKQGGSDVRANTTRAQSDGHDAWGARYVVTGHKWFFSAPMSDAFLILAYTPGGCRACFFRACCRTARATPSASSGSRTSWATAPTPAARSSSTLPPRGSSVRRGAAWRRFWRWARSHGWIARWARRG